MDILDRVKQLQDIYSDEPRPMDQEPRNNYSNGLSVDPERDSFKKISNVLGAFKRYRRGEKNPALNFNQFFELFSKENFATGGSAGQLVSNTVDGSRPGYAGSLTAKQQQKIIEAFPDTVFDFDKYPMSGSKKYLTSDQNKANPDHTKVERFKKKGFSLEMGTGLNTRGVPYSKEGKRLSIKDQNKIKAKYDLPEGVKEWDFKTYKYGIKSGGKENLLARMTRTVAEKGQWTLAADFGGPKGWMMAQMQRVFKNESKNPNIKKLTYKPVYAEVSGQDRIVGFKDNTAAGQGKTYYGLKKYTKKGAGDWTKHGDWKLNNKLIDISKRAKKAPNEVIMGLLKDKNFKGNNLKLNDLIHFLSGTEATSKAVIKNAVVRHHNSGVKFGSATNDLTLTTSIINKRIVEAEQRIAAGNVLPEDVQLLRNNNVYVRGANDKLYGAGKKSPIGQFKQIESSVAGALESNTDFKGNKFKPKELLSYLEKLGCGKAAGGRIMFGEGTSCAIKGKKILAEGLKTGFKKGEQAMLATAILKGGRSLKDIAKLKNLVGPAALAFLAAEEAGYVSYDMLSKGKSFKEAIGDSAFNYLLGDKTKVDAKKERNKRMIEEGMTSEQMGKIGNLESQSDRIIYGNSLLNKIQDAEQGQLDEMSEDSDFSYLPNRTDEFKKQEDDARKNLREFYRGNTNFTADKEGGQKALAEGLRRNEIAQLRSVDNIFQSRKGDENRAATISDLMLEQKRAAMPDMGQYPTTLGFAGGGIASLKKKYYD